MEVKLHIVIATIGRSRLLARALQSLSNCDLPECYKGTLVVHNGSSPTRQIQDLVASYSESIGATFIHVSRPNKSVALNTALDLLDDNCLAVFFDDDVRIEPQVVTAYAHHAKQNSDAFFGGPLNVDLQSVPPEWVRMALPPSAVGWTPTRVGPHELFLGANWAAFVRHIKEAGGFDETFGPGRDAKAEGDETMLQIQLRARGLRQIYIPTAMVWHYVPKEKSSPWWALRKAYRVGKAYGLSGEKKPDKRRLDIIFLRQLLRLAKFSYQREPSGMFDAICKLVRDCGEVRGAVKRAYKNRV